MMRVCLSLIFSAYAHATHPRWVSIAPGVEMPVVSQGYIAGGPQQRGPGTASYNQTVDALLTWFRVGGRGLDTAWKYRNQEAYGEAIRRSGLKRSDIFVTTKIPCVGSSEKALELVRQDVARLGTYADAVIIHGTGFIPPYVSGNPVHCWDDGSPSGFFTPCCQNTTDIQATYHGLELALQENLTRVIGVSSYQINHLQAVLATAKVAPAINQCEEFVGRHINSSDATIDFCKKRGITYMAFSPLGNMQTGKTVLKNPVVLEIAKARNVSAAQIGMAWIQQKGMTMVTASNNAKHLTEDLAIEAIDLSSDEMSVLDNAPTDPASLVV